MTLGPASIIKNAPYIIPNTGNQTTFETSIKISWCACVCVCVFHRRQSGLEQHECEQMITELSFLDGVSP